MTTALTAPNLRDLFDPDDLELMLQQGYVRQQNHPTEVGGSLAIFNYTEKAAFEGVWNDVTLACRGLIVRGATGEVLARPFRKFFNHGQAGAPGVDLDAEVIVTDKMDGSLGILYPLPSGGWAIATRGSFASDQAEHATAVWQQRYAHLVDPVPGVTYLFEIVYPSNRIVVDYGDLDDLVLLGGVDITTGRTVERESLGWPGPVAEVFRHNSLTEALAAPPRPNREGLVVHFVRTDDRLKLKQADYVAMHRIVTGLSERTVWQHLVDGKPLAELVEPLPDEFYNWAMAVAARIVAQVDTEHHRLLLAYEQLHRGMPADWFGGTREGRKAFAGAVGASPDRWAMFACLDGKDIRPRILANAKPEPFRTPSGRTYTEDTA